MNIEFEATFPDVNIEDVQARLRAAHATLVKKRTLYRRVTFNLPNWDQKEYIWARVRDEGDKITMAIKGWDSDGIEGQKELELEVNDYDTAVAFMAKLGCDQKAYQETYREEWILDNVHITIDEWPWLEPFVEIEGQNEEDVKMVSKKLGFDYSNALFMGVTAQYMKKYNLSHDQIDHKTPRITFDVNPFIQP